MSLYEIVFIARQDLAAEDVDSLADKFSKIITDAGGKVKSTEYWGLRLLAYPIKKNGRGHYILLNVDSDYPAVAELKRVMGFNEDVIRSNIFKVLKHESESPLFASKNAKSYKHAEVKEKGAPSKFDSILDQVQFEA